MRGARHAPHRIPCAPPVLRLLRLLRISQYQYNFSQFEDETWSFVKQPTRWDGSDWLKIGMTGAGTFLVMQADQPIRNAVERDHRYSKSVPIELSRMYGELYSPVIFFGGFALHSLITGDDRTRKIAYEIGQASLYAGATTYLLKMAMGRARPYVNQGPKSFHPFSTCFSNRTISRSPGGHSTVAFVISTVLSRNVSAPWLKAAVYLPPQ